MQWLVEIDQSLFFWINTHLTNSVFDVFFPFITDLHKNVLFWVPMMSLLLFFLVKKFSKKGLVVFLFCALNIATIDMTGNYLFKKQFERTRPGDSSAIQSIIRAPYGGYSFISNHAANMFGFALFMGYFFASARVVLFFLAFLVAFSRVYNGVHFPSDVIGGALWGVLIAYLYIQFYLRWIEPRMTKK